MALYFHRDTHQLHSLVSPCPFYLRIPMPTIKDNYYEGTPFFTKCTSIEAKPGTWSSTKVEVFQGRTYDKVKKIGEYVRMYPNYAKETFCPFLIQGEWYALYSANYTATRVAKLTETEFVDWCGEEGRSSGFCPTDFYVPRYKLCKGVLPNGVKYDSLTFDNEYSEGEMTEYFNYQGDPGEQYEGEFWTDYGFLSGCIWGDDSSWKLRFIDLSEVPNKVLKIDERFGYFELPDGLKLRQCVRNESNNIIKLIQSRYYSLE